MPELSRFIKTEIVKYIEQELNKGHTLGSIRNALLLAGHHKDLIDVVILNLKKHQFNVEKMLKEPLHYPTKLQKTMYYNIVNALMKYITYHLERGENLESIKKRLYEFGHTKDTVEAALRTANEDDPLIRIPKDETRFFKKLASIVVFPMLLFLLIGFVLFVSITTQSEIGTVLISFSPAFAALFLAKILTSTIRQKFLALALPPLVTLGFYYFATESGSGLFDSIQIVEVTGLNFGISLVIVGLIIAVAPTLGAAPEKITHLKKEKKEEEAKKKEENTGEKPVLPPLTRPRLYKMSGTPQNQNLP